MSTVRSNIARLRPRLHESYATHVLPEFFIEQYPKLVEFLEMYYQYSNEERPDGFHEQIMSLFSVRDINTTELENLDHLLYEIGNEVDTTTFAKNPRLMAKLIANFHRLKGTQLSAEQFFRMFYDEPVEVLYPKRDIFVLNESRIGPQSLKFITDNKRYQIFSILLKTGLSLYDYEKLYKKFVHPAGFYLAADVVAVSQAVSGLRPGDPIDPLETPNYPIVMGSEVSLNVNTSYVLLTMRETDAVDSDIIISSVPLVSTYGDNTFQGLIDNGFTTIADLVDLNTPATIDDANLNLSSNSETMDTDEHL